MARLLGPLLVIVALPMILNPSGLQELARDFLKAPALMYITGVLVALAGLSIINSHNVWVAGWPVIITLFGWAMLLSGAARVVMPSVVVSIGSGMLDRPIMSRVSGVIWAALGLLLAYAGYF